MELHVQLIKQKNTLILPNIIHLQCVHLQANRSDMNVRFFLGRVQAEEDVAEPERNHPKHSGRDGFPGANHLQDNPTIGPRLDPVHRHRQTRPW